MSALLKIGLHFDDLESEWLGTLTTSLSYNESNYRNTTLSYSQVLLAFKGKRLK